MSHADQLVFALPPSMGLESIRPIARELADMLSGVGFCTVFPTRSYEELERVLETGEAHAAWAPPAVCAHIEGLGGEVMFRAVRMGTTSYRSALLCRGERSIDLKRVADMSGIARIRAAWVDRHSVAGYLMPRHYLRQRGAVLSTALEESLLGSYQACFDAVLEGDADLTASYVGRRGSGYIDLLGNTAAELRVLAWSDEIPNDGVVLSPALSPDMARRTEAALSSAFRNIRFADRLAMALDADGFEVPAPDSYAGVRALMVDDDLDDDSEVSDCRHQPRRRLSKRARMLRLRLAPAFM